MTKEEMQVIDDMSQVELCKRWRFSPLSDPMFKGESGKYFQKKLIEKSGFTVKISKELGW